MRFSLILAALTCGILGMANSLGRGFNPPLPTFLAFVAGLIPTLILASDSLWGTLQIPELLFRTALWDSIPMNIVAGALFLIRLPPSKERSRAALLSTSAVLASFSFAFLLFWAIALLHL